MKIKTLLLFFIMHNNRIKEFYRIMKISLFLLFVCICQLMATETEAQNTVINIRQNSLSIKQLIIEIEKQTDYLVVYRDQDVDVNKIISFRKRKGKVSDYLDEVYREAEVGYVFGNDYITLTPKTTGANQNRKKLSGKVVDLYGDPVIGASVVEKGTTNGTITDLEGVFTLEVGEAATILVSYIGYREQTISATGKSNISVQLLEDSQALDEVVVVGFGTQKKVNLTGSVATINFTDQLSRPVTNVSSALAGLTSGVSVSQKSGNPGSDGATIRIRGLGTLNDSDPLILVDGIEASMDAINPQDVESISILKDAASSAIYGSRAANGVVLITTKNGKKGKLNVTYSGRVSITKPVRFTELVSDYADYMEFMNEGFFQLDQAGVFAQSTIDQWREANKNPNAIDQASGLPNYIVFPNTNWHEEFFSSQKNPIQEHNLSLNGGSDKIRFMASLGYLDNPGLVINTGIKKYSVRTNIEADVTDWLTVGSRFWGNQQDKGIGDFKKAMTFVAQSAPGVYPKYNGILGGAEAAEERAGNPYTHLLTKIGTNTTNLINETFFAKINPFKGFEYEIRFNYEKFIEEKSSHSNDAVSNVRFSDNTVVSPVTVPSQMTTDEYRFNHYKYTLENLVRYNTKIKEHSIGGLLGYQEYYYYQNGLYTTKRGLLDGNIYAPSSAQEMVSITSKDSDGKETIYDVATRSFFGRINYGFKDRYLFEANLRYDASSKFNKDHRWGAFPSFSGAWRLSEEEFMNSTRGVLDNLKIRASWGRLGNTNGIDNYASQSTYSILNYSMGGTQAQGVYQGTLANPLITWESTAVLNFGVDATLFNNRLTAEVELYKRFTDGILYKQTLPLTVGDKTAPVENLAEVTNKGIEITLGWNDRIGEVQYAIGGNFGYNKNEVTKYKGPYEAGWVTAADGTRSWVTNLGDVTTGDVKRVAEGKIINEYYIKSVYRGSGNYFNADGKPNKDGGPRDGMIRTEDDMKWLRAMKDAGYYFAPRLNSVNAEPGKTTIWYGDYIFADTNGDGIYGNSFDNTFRGESNFPKFNYGIQLSASYRGFDISMNWAGAGGFSLYWAPDTGYNTPQVRHGVSIPRDIAYDHYFYDPANPSDPRTNIHATYGRLINSEGGYQNNYESDLYLFKGDYLKLKNLTIGYTLPVNISQKVFAQSIRAYVSGENLLTITKYPGVDPEMDAGVGYPTIKQFAFGLNVTF